VQLEIGLRLGMLRVVAEAPRNRFKQRCWECLCDCGNTSVVAQSNLRLKSRSCGCQIRETVLRRNHKHGHATSRNRDPLYSVWLAMKDRCLNPNNVAYANYGGRGIGISDEWVSDFEAYVRDLGPKPSPSHTVERRDNNLGYSKENCYWATRKQQMANTRRSVTVPFDGRRVSMEEASQLSGIPYSTIRSRRRLGWPDDRLLSR
jgi:hypothetical protein